MDMPVGERFARAIAAKDESALLDLLAPQLDCRAMTPGRFWEPSSPAELVHDVILGKWFDDNDHIDGIEAIDSDTVADRQRVGYRFRVTNADGTFLVEQQAYLGVEDDRVAWLRIMCCGYRPVSTSTA
jgi:hypothetical protein